MVLARGWRQEQARKRRQAILNIVLQTTLLDARRRGHEVATPEHTLRVLLDVPEVAAAWEARAWPLDEACAALEAELAGRSPSNPPRATAGMSGMSADLFAAVRRAEQTVAARGSGREAAGRDMLSFLVRELVSPQVTSGALVAKASASYAYDTFLLGPADAATVVGPPASPYRSLPRAPSASVVLWNDATTHMEAVVGILREIFGLSETRATYLMLCVHTLGRVVVGPFGPAEAKDLAARAMGAARARGLPMRLTVEPRS